MATDLAKLVVRLEAQSSKLQTDLDKANNKLSKFERQASAAAAKVKSSLGGMFAGVGASLGAATLASSLRATIDNADKAEQQLFKLEQLVQATGASAGLSAREIDQFSRNLARSTLASTQGVRDAAAALLTFRSISGDTFKGTLRLAQDMSAALGTNLRSSVLQLGKALEDPARGLAALRESGVSFTEAQKDLISSLQDSGNLLDAQAVILDKVREQVGGAASAEAGGLSGSVDTLSQNWSEFLETIGNSGPLQTAKKLVDDLAGGIAGLNRALFTPDQDRFYELADRRRELLERLSSPLTGQARRQRNDMRRELADVNVEMRALQDANIARMREEREAQVMAENAADERARQTELENERVRQVQLQLQRQRLAEQARRVAEKEAARFATSLQKLEDRLDPTAAKTRDYLEQVDLLNRAWADTGNDRYLELVEQLAEGTEKLKAETKDLDSTWNDLGFTMSSRFEDAIIEGQKLRDVVQGLGQDIAQMVVRQSFTKPLSNSISGGLSGLDVSGFLGSLFGNSQGGLYKVAGSGAGERPVAFTAQPGEYVHVYHDAQKASGRAATGGGVVNVNVINNASGTQATARSRSEGGNRVVDIMIEQVKNSIAGDIARGAGSLPSVLERTYGVNRVAGAT